MLSNTTSHWLYGNYSYTVSFKNWSFELKHKVCRTVSFFLSPERSLAASQFILYTSRTTQSLRGMNLKIFSEKQTSDQIPFWTDVSYKVYKCFCISVVLRRWQKSWVSVIRWHLCVLSASFWFIVSLLGHWFLPSSATAIGSLLHDVPFVLLYLCLLLIHDPFTKISYF